MKKCYENGKFIFTVYRKFWLIYVKTGKFIVFSINLRQKSDRFFLEFKYPSLKKVYLSFFGNEWIYKYLLYPEKLVCNLKYFQLSHIPILYSWYAENQYPFVEHRLSDHTLFKNNVGISEFEYKFEYKKNNLLAIRQYNRFSLLKINFI